MEAALVFGQEEAGTAVCRGTSPDLISLLRVRRGQQARPIQAPLVHLLQWPSRRRQLHCLGRQARPGAPTHPEGPATKTLQGRGRPIGGLSVPVGESRNRTHWCEKTGYNILHASVGRFRGRAEGQDVHGNLDIGVLTHDC